MSTMEENNITEEAEGRHILIKKITKKRGKNNESIPIKNLKSSIVLKTSLNQKKNLNNKLKQLLPNTNPKKKVKFNDDIIIVDIECWKGYNLEQTVEEKPEDYTKDINNNEDIKEKNSEIKKKKRDKKNINKDNNISCTCMII